LIIGVPRESAEGERRVALVPESVKRLGGASIVVEASAGSGAGYPDSAYVEAGASTKDSRAVFAESDLVLKVQPPTAAEASMLKEGSAMVSFLFPTANLDSVKGLVSRKATAFAMELMPRISRAQSMDALSSQSTISGYKSVLMAADALPRLFPMMMTAAGTITPAKVFVLGAGVAGLEAIATAHRLGAVVEGYDVRPAVKEQVESLGAKFVELPIQTANAQTAGGYASAQSDEFYRKQQELLAEHAKASDVVITTALVPGKKAPMLVSEEAVMGMKEGSVVVDLAAEQGGNCALTEPGKTVVKHGVVIIGPLNLPSTMAPQASQLYSRNVATFVATMMKGGELLPNEADELVRGTMVVNRGVVVHEGTRKALEAQP